MTRSNDVGLVNPMSSKKYSADLRWRYKSYKNIGVLSVQFRSTTDEIFNVLLISDKYLFHIWSVFSRFSFNVFVQLILNIRI